MSSKKKIAKKIGLGLLIVLIVIQFVRFDRNSGIAATPNDINHYTAVPSDVKTILETSCYDCHSDHTVYPWYSNLQPVGWWLTNHVNEGKRELNFSKFKSYRIKRQIDKLQAIADEVKEDGMPLDSYLWIHGNAKLNEAQKKTIMNWANHNFDSLAKIYPDSLPKEED